MPGLVNEAVGPFVERVAANEASVFLIVGGLIVLGVVLVLVVIRSVLPSGRPERGDRRMGALGRELRRTPDLADVPAIDGRIPLTPQDLERGRKAARRVAPRQLEDALDHAVRSGWAEPRILNLSDARTLIRYYHCDECERDAAAATKDPPGCGFNAGYLEGAFKRLGSHETLVRETSCRRRGGAVCEFEVRTP
jgi:V4R domain-containing protein